MTDGGERKALFSFGYARSPDQDAAEPVRHAIAVVGAGPVGLAFALDMAGRGHKVVVLDDADRIGEGSRGICYSKRTLEILNRLGPGKACVDKGVTWKLGKVFNRDAMVYQFDLLPEEGHQMPAFINLQQYYLEHYLVEDAVKKGVEIRWRNKVTNVTRGNDGVRVDIETPDGAYAIQADWLIAADGARSTVRDLLELEWRGEVFEDRFLIADVKMVGDYPSERWFWFEPPFHNGHSALLHKQPDDIWRIDLQLGPEADAREEQQPEKVTPRIRQMLGHDNFELEWVSLYTFQCRRIDEFVHGRIVFIGDAAHQVSPFGARGANSGIQDAENLAWKLSLVLNGEADERLIETYHDERSAAADENILHSTRSTDFIAPRSRQEMRFRDAALQLAGATSATNTNFANSNFAKALINSGRLSTAKVYETVLSTPDRDAWAGSARLGAPAPDAPVAGADGNAQWFLEALDGEETLVFFNGDGTSPPQAACRTLVVGKDVEDTDGILTARFDATPGAAFLFRPDQHLAARWRKPDAADIEAARQRCRGNDIS